MILIDCKCSTVCCIYLFIFIYFIGWKASYIVYLPSFSSIMNSSPWSKITEKCKDYCQIRNYRLSLAINEPIMHTVARHHPPKAHFEPGKSLLLYNKIWGLLWKPHNFTSRNCQGDPQQSNTLQTATISSAAHQWSVSFLSTWTAIR